MEALRQYLGLAHLLTGQAQPVDLVALKARVDLAAHAAEELQLADKACIGLDKAALGLDQLVGGQEVQIVVFHYEGDDRRGAAAHTEVAVRVGEERVEQLRVGLNHMLTSAPARYPSGPKRC